MQSDNTHRIFRAIQKKDLEQVTKLITEEGYDSNVTQATTKISALMQSAMFGSLEITEFLLEQGADINALNALNGSALHLAAMYGHSDQVDYLIHKGANIHNVEVFFGNTPLHSAVRSATGKIYKNIRANSENDSSDNQVDFYSTVAMLLTHGVDPSAVNRAGKTAVDIATENGDENLLEILHENIPQEFVTVDDSGNIEEYYSKENVCPAGDVVVDEDNNQ